MVTIWPLKPTFLQINMEPTTPPSREPTTHVNKQECNRFLYAGLSSPPALLFPTIHAQAQDELVQQQLPMGPGRESCICLFHHAKPPLLLNPLHRVSPMTTYVSWVQVGEHKVQVSRCGSHAPCFLALALRLPGQRPAGKPVPSPRLSLLLLAGVR